MLQRAVAVATLTVAASEEEAVRRLSAIPDLADASQEVLRDIAWWLRSLYEPAVSSEGASDTAWFRPLRPDPIGDALIAELLHVLPQLPNDLLVDATPEQIARTLTVLTGTARFDETARAVLERLVDERLGSIWRTALSVAQQAGEPLGDLLTGVLERHPQPELAVEIERDLPASAIALRKFAAVVVRQALDANFRASASARMSWRSLLTRQKADDSLVERARLESRLSACLSNLGQYTEARAYSEQALAKYRRLAGRTDSDTIVDGLITTRLQRALTLAASQPDEAAAIVREAVALTRQLAGQRPNMQLRVAIALHDLSCTLVNLNKPQEAVEASDESVATFRTLSAIDSKMYVPFLAGALGQLAAANTRLQRYEDAVRAGEEAVKLYRSLAEALPDLYLPELAVVLSELQSALLSANMHEEAGTN